MYYNDRIPHSLGNVAFKKIFLTKRKMRRKKNVLNERAFYNYILTYVNHILIFLNIPTPTNFFTMSAFLQ